MATKSSKGGNWVTINGVHVLIENGKITKGPAKFIGSTLNDLPSSQKGGVADKDALKEKYAGKAKPSTSNKTKAEGTGIVEKPGETMGDYYRRVGKSALSARGTSRRGVSPIKESPKTQSAEDAEIKRQAAISNHNLRLKNSTQEASLKRENAKLQDKADIATRDYNAAIEAGDKRKAAGAEKRMNNAWAKIYDNEIKLEEIANNRPRGVITRTRVDRPAGETMTDYYRRVGEPVRARGANRRGRSSINDKVSNLTKELFPKAKEAPRTEQGKQGAAKQIAEAYKEGKITASEAKSVANRLIGSEATNKYLGSVLNKNSKVAKDNTSKMTAPNSGESQSDYYRRTRQTALGATPRSAGEVTKITETKESKRAYDWHYRPFWGETETIKNLEKNLSATSSPRAQANTTNKVSSTSSKVSSTASKVSSATPSAQANFANSVQTSTMGDYYRRAYSSMEQAAKVRAMRGSSPRRGNK